MKKLLAVLTVVILIGFGNNADAQKKSIATKAKNTTKTVGNAVASTASKASSRVIDKVYKDKTGPDGQTVYIDNKSKYYWVDKKGHRVYATAAELKNKE